MVTTAGQGVRESVVRGVVDVEAGVPGPGGKGVELPEGVGSGLFRDEKDVPAAGKERLVPRAVKEDEAAVGIEFHEPEGEVPDIGPDPVVGSLAGVQADFHRSPHGSPSSSSR